MNELALTAAQRGTGDMDPEEFRAAAHRVADEVADYLASLETYRIVPDIEPGDVRSAMPPRAPAEPEPLAAILEDYRRLIRPNVTHWQHPGFMAYFSSVACGPGILGEWLSAGLNSNVMFWRNAPASTEVEELVVQWLRGMLGLPDSFDGMLTDTASVSTLLSLVAARQAVPGLHARERGLAGRPEVGPLTVYVSEESHVSVEKAALVVGVGKAGVRRIAADAEFRMRADLLREAVEADLAAGKTPFCVTATLGTTSSTSVDPVGEMASICREFGLWLHVDAAYAGAAALLPEKRPLFDGWERADSIVFNPHKWLFTPFDASLLLFRRPEIYREAFSIVPEYLRTPKPGDTHNFNEYGIQLGRRFRALKLWMLIRYFGVAGLAARVRRHCEMAATFSRWVDESDGWERMAPVPFSTVCLRWNPAAGTAEPADPAQVDAFNEKILERANRAEDVYLSHTRLAGRFAIRVALGNPRGEMRHVRRCWDVLNAAARSVAA